MAFSYPEPFLRAARRGALAKSITGYHENMVRKQYPVLELANQMPVRIWPEPLVAPRVRRALGTRMVLWPLPVGVETRAASPPKFFAARAS